jgi:predicted RNase H-like HicB family nuclease
MKTLKDHTVVVGPDSGAYVAYIPAIEGCHAIGDTPEEAQRELGYVFEMFSEIFEEQGRALPPDVQRLLAVAG